MIFMNQQQNEIQYETLDSHTNKQLDEKTKQKTQYFSILE